MGFANGGFEILRWHASQKNTQQIRNNFHVKLLPALMCTRSFVVAVAVSVCCCCCCRAVAAVMLLLVVGFRLGFAFRFGFGQGGIQLTNGKRPAELCSSEDLKSHGKRSSNISTPTAAATAVTAATAAKAARRQRRSRRLRCPATVNIQGRSLSHASRTLRRSASARESAAYGPSPRQHGACATSIRR